MKPGIPQRRDGKNTQQVILQQAQQVFAEFGYRGATVKMLAAAAQCNAAAISYYFGGKFGLYAEAWRASFAEAKTVYPIHGGVASSAPAKHRLRGFIRARIGFLLDHQRAGVAGHLLMREFREPTPALADVRRQALSDHLQHARSLVAELLQVDAQNAATDERVDRCLGSIIAQILTLCAHIAAASAAAAETNPHRPQPGVDLFGPAALCHGDHDALADHLTCFCLGGIEALITAESLSEPEPCCGDNDDHDNDNDNAHAHSHDHTRRAG